MRIHEKTGHNSLGEGALNAQTTPKGQPGSAAIVRLHYRSGERCHRADPTIDILRADGVDGACPNEAHSH
jgi:hypothetical protein